MGGDFHVFDISKDGILRSERARTSCHARCPDSVTAYRPPSTFVRRPSVLSFWRWNESFDDESTKFFLMIPEYAAGSVAGTYSTISRRIVVGSVSCRSV